MQMCHVCNCNILKATGVVTFVAYFVYMCILE